MKLALIITGQLRTFNTARVQEAFNHLLTSLKSKYSVVLFFVLNDSTESISFDYGVPFVITQVKDKMEGAIIKIANLLDKEPTFHEYVADAIVDLHKDNVHHTQDELEFIFGIKKENCKPFQWEWNNTRLPQNPDIDFTERNPNDHHHYATVTRQIIQIQYGLDSIEEYEKLNGKFDVVMRNRTDTLPPRDFLPFGFDNDFFPHSAIQLDLYKNNCASHGLDPTQYNATCFHIRDYARIPGDIRPFNFGGIDCLKKTLSVQDPYTIIWSYNDYIFISGRDTFFKYKNYFDMFKNDLVSVGRIHDVRWRTAHEAQHILFYLANGIEYRMYRDDTHTYCS